MASKVNDFQVSQHKSYQILWRFGSSLKKNIKPIGNLKERVMLGDILPYELPPTYSNRYLFQFIVENGISLNGNVLSWNKISNNNSQNNIDFLSETIKLLFGISGNIEQQSGSTRKSIKLGQEALKKIPFTFQIARSGNNFRELTIVHPLNQLSIVEFYEKYKELILYYSSISPFSIRRPSRKAKFKYHKDSTHFKRYAYDHEHARIEEIEKEYENLKTYFAYKDYSNIYKFFESYRYQRCEKKFDNLFQFDISKCFDSIYTHSISWAIFGKGIVKDNLTRSKTTFPGAFDKLMQDLNYGETNGIIIGPEFSRIFAELILQQIDLNFFRSLRENKKLYHKRDYELFRYVDDYFLFYNEEKTRNDVFGAVKMSLKDFKFSINDSKSFIMGKPLITGITKAKTRISDLLNKTLKSDYEAVDENDENDSKGKYSLYFSSNQVITGFKTIISETNISYSDILSYTFGCIDRKLIKIIKVYDQIIDKVPHERKFVKGILEILDFTSFIYAVSPKVNTTIKLCAITSKITRYVKIRKHVSFDNKHSVFKKISDDIFLVLRKYQKLEYAPIEILYLLITLKDLGSDYRLDEQDLSSYFNIKLDKRNTKLQLDYFSITVLLFYIENIKRYSIIKKVLRNCIKRKFEEINTGNRGITTELSLLLFDVISCPFLDRPFKNEIFKLNGIDSRAGRLKSGIINENKYWQTKWTDFDFGKELWAKKSQEVY
jgi:hypothetical protein